MRRVRRLSYLPAGAPNPISRGQCASALTHTIAIGRRRSTLTCDVAESLLRRLEAHPVISSAHENNDASRARAATAIIDDLCASQDALCVARPRSGNRSGAASSWQHVASNVHEGPFVAYARIMASAGHADSALAIISGHQPGTTDSSVAPRASMVESCGLWPSPTFFGALVTGAARAAMPGHAVRALSAAAAAGHRGIAVAQAVTAPLATALFSGGLRNADRHRGNSSPETFAASISVGTAQRLFGTDVVAAVQEVGRIPTLLDGRRKATPMLQNFDDNSGDNSGKYEWVRAREAGSRHLVHSLSGDRIVGNATPRTLPSTTDAAVFITLMNMILGGGHHSSTSITANHLSRSPSLLSSSFAVACHAAALSTTLGAALRLAVASAIADDGGAVFVALLLRYISIVRVRALLPLSRVVTIAAEGRLPIVALALTNEAIAQSRRALVEAGMGRQIGAVSLPPQESEFDNFDARVDASLGVNRGLMPVGDEHEYGLRWTALRRASKSDAPKSKAEPTHPVSSAEATSSSVFVEVSAPVVATSTAAASNLLANALGEAWGASWSTAISAAGDNISTMSSGRGAASHAPLAIDRFLCTGARGLYNFARGVVDDREHNIRRYDETFGRSSGASAPLTALLSSSPLVDAAVNNSLTTLLRYAKALIVDSTPGLDMLTETGGTSRRSPDAHEVGDTDLTSPLLLDVRLSIPLASTPAIVLRGAQAVASALYLGIRPSPAAFAALLQLCLLVPLDADGDADAKLLLDAVFAIIASCGTSPSLAAACRAAVVGIGAPVAAANVMRVAPRLGALGVQLPIDYVAWLVDVSVTAWAASRIDCFALASETLAPTSRLLLNRTFESLVRSPAGQREFADANARQMPEPHEQQRSKTQLELPGLEPSAAMDLAARIGALAFLPPATLVRVQRIASIQDSV